MHLTDENAFGLMLILFGISDLEYGSEPEEFVTRFTQFRTLALAEAQARPLGEGALALDLGHAVYFEIADGDQATDPIAWLRALCAPLAKEFEISAVLTHGGRWTPESPDLPEVTTLDGGYRLLRISYPSEPLQRALQAYVHCQGTDGPEGWGSGLFVDTEAVEALGKVLKNAPTPLVTAAGATFYRLGLPR